MVIFLNTFYYVIESNNSSILDGKEIISIYTNYTKYDSINDPLFIAEYGYSLIPCISWDNIYISESIKINLMYLSLKDESMNFYAYEINPLCIKISIFYR